MPRRFLWFGIDPWETRIYFFHPDHFDSRCTSFIFSSNILYFRPIRYSYLDSHVELSFGFSTWVGVMKNFPTRYIYISYGVLPCVSACASDPSHHMSLTPV